MIAQVVTVPSTETIDGFTKKSLFHQTVDGKILVQDVDGFIDVETGEYFSENEAIHFLYSYSQMPSNFNIKQRAYLRRENHDSYMRTLAHMLQATSVADAVRHRIDAYIDYSTDQQTNAVY